jgi:3-oxoacyl-[acyl-carrier protein] reductase
MTQRFRNRVALITGAARGMGRACALAFAGEGARVVVVDANLAGAQGVCGEIESAGGKGIALSCDVSRSDHVGEMLRRALEAFGTIDILVNNAGILRATTPLETISEEEWDMVLDVNLKGAFLCTRAVLPIMRKRHYGKIVNISSSAGRSTSELGGAHYTVSKTGMLGLTRHTAREYGQYGINVNSICPGLVETPMIREQASKERLDHWLKQIPLGRFADPSEEADLVLFLCSEEARYITGATIDFNGGSLLL